MHIAPLRLDADGIHRLTVNLHPVDLGPVQVVAEIRDGSITMQITGTTDAGHEALREALGDLRRELEESGFTNCSLDLRQGAAGDQEARRQFAAPARTDRVAPTGATTGPVVEPTTPPRTAGGGNGRLDTHA
jgi:flagellar hook-length control protein FliK